MATTQKKLYKVTKVRARKPAQVKMCPYCKKDIAARGLAGHIRIVHPEKLGLPKPIPKTDSTDSNNSIVEKVVTITYFDYGGRRFHMSELISLADRILEEQNKK